MDLVRRLPEREVLNLARMVEEWSAEMVDQRFEASVEAGAFDALTAEAMREIEAGNTIPLDEFLDDTSIS